MYSIFSPTYRMLAQVPDPAVEDGCLPHHHRDVPLRLHEHWLVHLATREGVEDRVVGRGILPVPGGWVGGSIAWENIGGIG